ncbi:MAG: NAD-dependent epimerase/dehydratase family protein [Anaerolineales bacterium]|nr:NAD-dependent epimerase/dehydratase family protein [Anaerolineales bacterium]
MRKSVVLITGASGEIGHALVENLSISGECDIVTVDLQDLPKDIEAKVSRHIKGSITDKILLDDLASRFEIDVIYHLAALLSTRAEIIPGTAHRVNVEGTLLLLELAAEQSQFRGKPVKFIFPSSIAAYGMPDLATKAQFKRVREWEWNYPTTMYGANKLYCERLGIYFSNHYKQLSEEKPITLDFRCLRYPGLISAFTMPSGGTSDYGPEMLHAAAKGEPYACFVRPDTTINFMAMPDAVKAAINLAHAPADSLTQRVYNITAFSLSAAEFREKVLEYFPGAEISYKVHQNRQGIVDTWPMDTDDNHARRDWGWSPDYDLDRCFGEYLVPNIKQRYQ